MRAQCAPSIHICIMKLKVVIYCPNWVRLLLFLKFVVIVVPCHLLLSSRSPSPLPLSLSLMRLLHIIAERSVYRSARTFNLSNIYISDKTSHMFWWNSESHFFLSFFICFVRTSLWAVVVVVAVSSLLHFARIVSWVGLHTYCCWWIDRSIVCAFARLFVYLIACLLVVCVLLLFVWFHR